MEYGMMRGKRLAGGMAMAVVMVLAAMPARAEKHPLTFEEMLELQTPASPVISPDGARVAFVVSGRDLETNSGWSRLYVMDLGSEESQLVSAGGTHEGEPAWSPDGSRLAFISDKEEGAQIWVQEGDGAPVQVTHLATEASAPTWSNDGERLYFLSRVYPLCKTPECNRMNLEEEAANPVKARAFTQLMYRHWDHWRDDRVAHVHAVPRQAGAAVDLMAGEEWGVIGAWAVTPDGGHVIYETKNPERETLTTNNDIYRMAVDVHKGRQGDPERLTVNEAWDSHPVLSPDGASIAYVSHARPRFESDLAVLTVLSSDGTGEPRRLTADLDRPVMAHGWFPDSRRLWFAVLDTGRVGVYTIASSGGKAEPLLAGAWYSDFAVGPEGRWMAAVKQSLTMPPELFLFAVDAEKERQLTRINEDVLADVELATVEDVWWEGADGDKVHGLLLFPPGTSRDQKNPFLLLVHGGPQGMWSDKMHPRWNAQLFAAPGYVTLLANPRGSVGYGQKFTDQISRDWGGKVYTDLMNGVDHLVAQGWVDPERMCAAGGSYGGYMVNWMEGHTDRFQCLISHAGVYDLQSKYGTTDELWFPEWEFGGPPWESEDYTKWSPSNYVENFTTPMLVIHGAHDYRVTEGQAMQLFTALQRRGVPSRFLYYPDETHFVVKPKNSQLWYDEIHAWLGRWIGDRNQE